MKVHHMVITLEDFSLRKRISIAAFLKFIDVSLSQDELTHVLFRSLRRFLIAEY